MTPKSKPTVFLFLTLLVTFSVSAAVGGRAEVALGGWRPIKNVDAPEIKEVAQFAVTEHNEEAGTNLEFQSVVKGETQVVSGINYRLMIAARDGAGSANYEAVVWVKPWAHYRNLTSFTKL